MADSTDDTNDTTTQTYVLDATVVGDTVRLTGSSLQGDTIFVPAGSDAIVKIKDATGYYLYASEIPPRGAKTVCWNRGANNNLAKRKFTAVDGEISNLVFAASSSSTSDVKYGPVIKIKPVGT